ncbi:toll/interleukin-1 receptor domain-containing protein [Plantibacter flavus]|uniref:toll/interleukin-1 receptor domain-containing protein n=1 Tax=Plantibacter flavus TaxID=150123 RepID=UPI002377F601|nr:toll/interleukin-1 receptor domain-containing protein [Plantibacter flavus]MDD9152594.1 toll/interleukin-1 receptor domain-containing protein [Plantibacter flavus]
MNHLTAASAEPRVFMSYASEPEHDEWVLRLATRLESNGVNVVLDQWDVGLGANLANFMEQGLSGSDRVICVCSDAYLTKANSGTRGVGYEKKILSAPLLASANSDHVIPVLRNVAAEPPVPTFLAGVRYVDFREDADFESSYRELVYDLYGVRVKSRPARGTSPFAAKSEVLAELALRFDGTAFETTALRGTAAFRYTDNDGIFTFGSDADRFQLHVSTAGVGSVHVYKDSSNIAAIGLAAKTPIDKIAAPEMYDGSSRVRTARVGDTVILTNSDGRVAAVEVLSVSTRDSAPDGIPVMAMQFAVLSPTL